MTCICDAEVERLRALLCEVHPFLLLGSTWATDELANRFYRDTGIMAPGKSVAMEMANSQPDIAVRRQRYEQWFSELRQRLAAEIELEQCARLNEELAALPEVVEALEAAERVLWSDCVCRALPNRPVLAKVRAALALLKGEL